MQEKYLTFYQFGTKSTIFLYKLSTNTVHFTNLVQRIPYIHLQILHKKYHIFYKFGMKDAIHFKNLVLKLPFISLIAEYKGMNLHKHHMEGF